MTLVVLVLVGCHASDAPANESASASTGAASTDGAEITSSIESSSGTTAAIDDGPPVVIDLGKSAAYVGEGERVIVTAFVQHPRGDEAVVAGMLSGPGEPADYGSFTRGVNGRWSIETGWDDVGTHIDLTFVNELDVELVARFVDDAGLEGEGTVVLPHQCTPLGPNACAGECVDVSISANHCGECDHPCAVQWPRIGVPVGGCGDGVCAPLWSECVDSDVYDDCASGCAALGSSCVDGGCALHTIMPVDDEASCGREIASIGFQEPDTCNSLITSPFARCCCSRT
jgi:hypothetical protein